MKILTSTLFIVRSVVDLFKISLFIIFFCISFVLLSDLKRINCKRILLNNLRLFSLRGGGGLVVCTSLDTLAALFSRRRVEADDLGGLFVVVFFDVVDFLLIVKVDDFSLKWFKELVSSNNYIRKIQNDFVCRSFAGRTTF